jgi:phosphoenolpyruvate-protein phosphotransferase (PTS system enzyme I)
VRAESEKTVLLSGKGLAPGLGWGTAYRVESQRLDFYRIRISEAQVESELARFRQAVAKAREQYEADKRKFEAVVGPEHSYIIDSHLLMLEDRQMLGEVEARVRESLESPERALRSVADRFLAAYESMEDSFFRDRAFDFEEVIERVFVNLAELASPSEVTADEDLVLVGSEIGLSVLARFPLDRVKGLVLSRAGETSHLVIIARSFRIPVVAGIERLKGTIDTGDQLLVDGWDGRVEVGSAEQIAQRAEELRRQVGRVHLETAADIEPCITEDGVQVHLLANTEFGREVGPALAIGAEGIGLFRTEFIYMRAGSGPVSEEEQYGFYRSLAEEARGLPVVVRTLDVAQRDSRVETGEEGGVLGLRGIRFSLQQPEVFQAQVRAVVRAREHGDLRLVLPMISSVDEVIQVRSLIDQSIRELNGRPVQVGALIEVPAAIMTLDSIARHVDFLAVGTNDLIQYTLAAGRLNDEIAYLYNPLHPAILRSLERIVRVSSDLDLEVTVCGEMAAHPLHALVLLGLGFRRLSMTSLAIPGIKGLLRRVVVADLELLASELLRLESLAEVQGFVEDRFDPSFKGSLTGAPSE